ncbi:MAG: hypothetical protein R2826_02485 [Thermoleophilia bacterium]
MRIREVGCVRAAGADDDRRPDSLYNQILATVRDVVAGGGRSDERDLFGVAGRYERIMAAGAASRPCPPCYVCPVCQV